MQVLSDKLKISIWKEFVWVKGYVWKVVIKELIIQKSKKWQILNLISYSNSSMKRQASIKKG